MEVHCMDLMTDQQDEKKVITTSRGNGMPNFGRRNDFYLLNNKSIPVTGMNANYFFENLLKYSQNNGDYWENGYLEITLPGKQKYPPLIYQNLINQIDLIFGNRVMDRISYFYWRECQNKMPVLTAQIEKNNQAQLTKSNISESVKLQIPLPFDWLYSIPLIYLRRYNPYLIIDFTSKYECNIEDPYADYLDCELKLTQHHLSTLKHIELIKKIDIPFTLPIIQHQSINNYGYNTIRRRFNLQSFHHFRKIMCSFYDQNNSALDTLQDARIILDGYEVWKFYPRRDIMHKYLVDDVLTITQDDIIKYVEEKRPCNKPILFRLKIELEIILNCDVDNYDVDCKMGLEYKNTLTLKEDKLQLEYSS